MLLKVLGLIFVIFLQSCAGSGNVASVRDVASMEQGPVSCYRILESFFKTKKLPVENIWGQFNLQNLDFNEYDKYFLKLQESTSSQISSPTKVEHYIAIMDSFRADLQEKYNIQAMDQLSELSQKEQEKIVDKINNFKIDQYKTSDDFKEFTNDILIDLRAINPKANSAELRDHDNLSKILSSSYVYHGLQTLVRRFPVKERFHRLNRMKYFISKILDYYPLTHFGNAYLLQSGIYLPIFIKTKGHFIPKDLMEKILIEGVENHKAEIEKILLKNKIHVNYNRFVESYKYISFLIGGYYLYSFAEVHEISLSNYQVKIPEVLGEFKESINKLVFEFYMKKIKKIGEYDNKAVEIIEFVNKSPEEQVEILVKESVALHKKETGQDLTEDQINEMREIFTSSI